MSEFESDLTAAFASEHDVSEDVAATAAENAAAFREEFAEDLTAETVLDAVAAAPYDDFEHQFDRAIGDLAADNEDCTDSREYRLSGYDDLAADPDMSA